MNFKKILPPAIIGAIIGIILMMVGQVYIQTSLQNLPTVSGALGLIIPLSALLISGFVSSYIASRKKEELPPKIISGFLSGMFTMLALSSLIFLTLISSGTGFQSPDLISLLLLLLMLLGGIISVIGSVICAFFTGFKSSKIVEGLKLGALKENPEMVLPAMGVVLLSKLFEFLYVDFNGGITSEWGVPVLLLISIVIGLIVLFVLSLIYVLGAGKDLKKHVPGAFKGVLLMVVPFGVLLMSVNLIKQLLGFPLLVSITSFVIDVGAFVFVFFASFTPLTESLEKSLKFVKKNLADVFTLFVLALLVILVFDILAGIVTLITSGLGLEVTEFVNALIGVGVLSYFINCKINFLSS